MYRNNFYCGLNDLPNSKLSNIFTIRQWKMKGLMILLFIIGTFIPSRLLIAQDGIVNTFTNLSTPEYSHNPQRIVIIAVLQAESKHYQTGNPGLEVNFDLFAKLVRQAAASQSHPDLICFPEFAISGWPYPTQEVINSLAEPIPGNGYWYLRYKNLAREIGTPILCWLVESDKNKLYNTVFMLDGKGEFKGKYRKIQATFGEQIWWGWSQGEQFELIELENVGYGVSICADMFFPETVRCYELLGADAVLHLSIFNEEVLFAQLNMTKANRGFALNSLSRGILKNWWKEGIGKVKIIE
jgi:predicted amidohydrolase